MKESKRGVRDVVDENYAHRLDACGVAKGYTVELYRRDGLGVSVILVRLLLALAGRDRYRTVKIENDSLCEVAEYGFSGR